MDRGRVPALDGLRGVAIGLVVIHHAGFMPGGWMGVSLFFTLSGYLITTLLLGEYRSTGTIELRAFYRRRAARLGPALVVALAATVALWAAKGQGTIATANVLIALLYLTNIARAFAPLAMIPVGWAWSLAIEEQFYLLWPLLLRWRLRAGAHPSRIAALLVALAVTIELTRAAMGSADRELSYNLIRGDELLLGCALALAPRTLPRQALLPAMLAFGALAVWMRDARVDFTLTVAAWASLLLLMSVLGSPRNPLTFAPLRYLGRISYSLYLWNGVLIFGGLTSRWYIFAQLALAIASTHLLEEPARRRLLRHREVIKADRAAVVPQSVLRGGLVVRVSHGRDLHAVALHDDARP